jgi:hypothetical protein
VNQFLDRCAESAKSVILGVCGRGVFCNSMCGFVLVFP